MKRFLALTLATVLTIGMLTACGESSSEAKTTTTTTMTTTTTTKQTTTTTTTSSESSVSDSSSISESDTMFMENVKKAMNGAKAKVKAFDFDESKIQKPTKYSGIDAECSITQDNETTMMTCNFHEDDTGGISNFTIRYKDGTEWLSKYYNYAGTTDISKLLYNEKFAVNRENIIKFLTAAVAAVDSENYSDKLIDEFTIKFNDYNEIKYKNYIYTLSYTKDHLVFGLLVTRLDKYNSSMDIANKPHFNGYEFAG